MSNNEQLSKDKVLSNKQGRYLADYGVIELSTKDKEMIRNGMSNKQDKYLFDYGDIKIAIEGKLVETSVEQAEELLGAPKGTLTHDDVVIASTIRTLHKHFDEDVRDNYMRAIDIDPIAPDLEHLTSVVK